jgi:hypothetical protein
MIKIDWSSLFSSFFSMVRIKIACKGPTKIPKKRLFEMKNSLYVIYFKVEGSVEARLDDDDDDDGGGGGGDNEDPGLGDDSGMEEFQHDALPDPEAPGEKGHEGSSTGGKLNQCAGSSNRDSSNKKVAT